MLICSPRFKSVISFVALVLFTSIAIAFGLVVAYGVPEYSVHEHMFHCIIYAGIFHYLVSVMNYPHFIGAYERLQGRKERPSHKYVESADQVITRSLNGIHHFNMCAGAVFALLVINAMLFYIFNISYANGVMFAWLDIWFL